MRLALQVGRPDFLRMAEEMTVEELAYWQAFYELEPFGDSWRRSGRMTTILANCWGAKLAADTEERFMPGWNPLENKQSTAEMMAAIREVKHNGS